MNFQGLGSRGSEIPVVSTDLGEVFSLAPITADIDGAFLANDGINQVRCALKIRASSLVYATPTTSGGVPQSRVLPQ